MSSNPQSNSSNGSPNNSPNNSKGDSKGDTKDGKEAAQRQALPFEPTKSRKQAEKPPKSSPASRPVRAEAAPRSATQSTASAKRSAAQEASIPDAVSQRMIKRMAVLCGVPTALGMSTFVVSYLLRVNDLFEVPTYAVLLVSLGWFGLGVLGLSYGVLSASWDEEAAGSRVGWSEFKTNWGRMTSAWRSSKDSAKEKS